MKDFYSQYIEDELWLIKETVWSPSLQNIRESQFTLGNGYFATRGVLEEVPYDAMPGTYISGIYDRMGSQVAELVNLPNPLNFRFTVGGEKIGLGAMNNLSHRRVLNTKKGLLLRRTIFENSKKYRFDYQSLRFISMDDKNIGVMQIALTPLDKACTIDIYTGIDTAVFNVGTVTEGRKKHFRIKELGQFRNAGYLAVETLEKKYTIVYWAGFYYELDNKKIFAKDNVFRLKLKKGQTVKFTKVFFIRHYPSDANLSKYKQISFKRFYKAFHTSLESLISQHIKVWHRLWKKADILVEGTANLQQNLRFNIYHMLICAHKDRGFSSIGARTLSGEGYRGHIFWDTEIFLLPFYLFNFPEIAKNMLLYRYKRLDKARELAAREGFRGAKFAWESADDGDEQTPGWSRDFDGTIIKIHTHEMEHHITADVAYAFYKYYLVTGDEKFMQDYGWEILFETARFWASRLHYNSRKKRYEINHVIGPDEFHIDVNNNAYTNMMAKWNLTIGFKMFYRIKRYYPGVFRRLIRKLDLREDEVRLWKKIAPQITININKIGLIEQFDGYYRLQEILPTATDENGIPLMPSGLKVKDLKKTQLIKQADVLMLVYLFDWVFKKKTKRVNYDFYIKRTLHKSSLSPSIHSIVASECADIQRAYNLFNVSLRTDISNLYGNTKEGIHAASLGGTWQAVIFGFAGVSIKRERLFINPRMPRTWGKLVFSLLWRQTLVQLEITSNTVKVKIISPKKKELEMGVFGTPVSIKPNKFYTFRRKVPILRPEYYHY
jgi:kojibiose phosphorylase